MASHKICANHDRGNAEPLDVREISIQGKDRWNAAGARFV